MSWPVVGCAMLCECFFFAVIAMGRPACGEASAKHQASRDTDHLHQEHGCPHSGKGKKEREKVTNDTFSFPSLYLMFQLMTCTRICTCIPLD